MITNEVCTCTHLFHFINYHIFILRQNISNWGKKSQLNIFHNVNSQFVLYTFYMLNIASHQRIYGNFFLLGKIHLEFHNIHAQFCIDVYI